MTKTYSYGKSEAYANRETGRIVAYVDYYENWCDGEGAAARIFAPVDNQPDNPVVDRYSFIDKESAEKFVEDYFARKK